MKYLSIIVLLVAFGAELSAQTIAQRPADVQALINSWVSSGPQATPTGNEAIVEQVGNFAVAEVEQSGGINSATAFTNSSGNKAADGAELNITQLGNANQAFGFQGNTDKGLRRSILGIDQTGSNNLAIIETGTNNTWNPSGHGSSNQHFKVIEQSGSNNIANMDVASRAFGDNFTTDIRQSGDFNQADLANLAERDGDATISQTSNGATTYFSGDRASFTLGAANEGNYAEQIISNNGTSQGASVISQNGNGNFAFQRSRFGGISTNQLGDSNFGDINQSGDNGNNPAEATLVQEGNNHFVALDQTGWNAFALIDQFGGDNNRLVGLGSSNYSRAQSLDGSSITLFQNGSDNVLMLGQSAGATANVMQVGNTNSVSVNQN